MAITKNRINNVDINRCVVYRMSRDELQTGNVVSAQSVNGDNTAYLRFDTSVSNNAVWTAFKNWWKNNPNLIMLGCMVWNNGTDANQNKGLYWCPVNRCATLRVNNDNYTKYLEFTIQRGDEGVFYKNTAAIVYQFYMINLTH